MTDYKTDYSQEKNVNTMDKGSYNDWGDGTPARQVLSKQPGDHTYDVSFGPKGEIKYIYNEVAAIAVGSEALVTSYTVPPGSEAIITSLKASGDNRAQFFVKKNGTILDTSRIWWMDFNAPLNLDGLKLIANDKIEVFVINRGADPAPFESTIGVDEYAI